MFWYIDPSHTAVNFSVKHMMVTTVRGSLGKVRGRIELDPEDPEKGDFEISATVKGISTGDARRDGHLQSADFFDAEKYPEITFKSNAVFPKGEGHYTASGDLTIREVTRPVSFDIELIGVVANAQGGQHLGARRHADDRSDGFRPHLEHADTERRPGRRQGQDRGRPRGA